MAQNNIFNELVDAGYELSIQTATTDKNKFIVSLEYRLEKMDITITDPFITMDDFLKLCDEELLRLKKLRLDFIEREMIVIQKQISSLENKLATHGS